MNIKKLSEALEWCGIDHNIEQDDDDSIEIMVSDDNIGHKSQNKYLTNV